MENNIQFWQEYNIQFWHELLKFLEAEYESAKYERDYAANRIEDLKAEPEKQNLIDGYEKQASKYGQRASLVDYFIKGICRKECP